MEEDGQMENETNVYEIPAPLKQVGFLYRLGVKNIPENLSRDEASEMIDNAREKQGGVIW